MKSKARGTEANSASPDQIAPPHHSKELSHLDLHCITIPDQFLLSWLHLKLI